MLVGSCLAFTVGVQSTRRTLRGGGSDGNAAPTPVGFDVEWEPSQSRLRRLAGPLVYVVREWDGGSPQPVVKVGWTGSVEPGAVGRRLGDWETGTRFPLRVEAVVPAAPQSLERALHRALGGARTSRNREWFEVEYDDHDWREIVEVTCRAHRPKEGAVA